MLPEALARVTERCKARIQREVAFENLFFVTVSLDMEALADPVSRDELVFP